jgi:hypothetical protein
MGSLLPPQVKFELNSEAFLRILERRTPGARLHESVVMGLLVALIRLGISQ